MRPQHISGPDVNSWGTYCPGEYSSPPPEYDTCLGDFYNVAWMEELASYNVTKLVIQILRNFEFPTERNWYLIGTGVLVGFTILLNVCSPSLLCFWMPLGKKQGVIFEDIAA